MTSDPISIEPEAKLQDAISVMAEKNIGNLVINKDGQPSTILTEREILTYLVKEGNIPDIQVKDVPTKPFVTVTPSDTVIKAAHIMIEERGGCLFLMVTN